MLYYGDRVRTVSPRAVVARVVARMRRAQALEEDARDEELLDALVESGQVAQGLADRTFEAEGHDGDDPAARAALGLTLDVARALVAPRAARRREGPWAVPRELDADLPRAVRVKVPEGYAYYALYPQAYALAARRVAARFARWFVIGIRSIGTSLGAVVAAALGVDDVVTVRPVGHPYHRQLRVGPALEARVRAAAAAGAALAVVDEGPGQSGSSFESVAAWLSTLGAAADQVVLFPGHPGPIGGAAPDERRAWWSGAPREAATFEEAVLARLAGAVERRAGPGPLHDVGAGRWRAVFARSSGAVPPVFGMQERRKYLAVRGARSLLVRFAGIGPYAEETLGRGRVLADAGWAPPSHAVFPGFLASPVAPVQPAQRRALPSAEEVARYIEDRARLLPASPEDGASSGQLLEMLRVNAREALGAASEGAVERFVLAARAAEALPRIAVDGKLEWWEWARSPQGRPWKLDATDHAFGHDLVGCQPATWDVAGARVELGLPRDAALSLASRVHPGADAATLAFHEAAYLAHRIGRWTFALQQEGDPDDRGRIERTLGRYRTLLRSRVLAG